MQRTSQYLVVNQTRDREPTDYENLLADGIEQAYARGLADLQVLAEIVPATGFVHGERPTSADAGIYGFIANIYYYPIPTPLKAFVDAHENLVAHCERIHAAVTGTWPG